MEMEQWWKRNSKVPLGGYTTVQVEDITGCIPLLLDLCVADGKVDLDVSAFRTICHEAAAFELKVKNKTKENPINWTLYVELLRPLGHS